MRTKSFVGVAAGIIVVALVAGGIAFEHHSKRSGGRSATASAIHPVVPRVLGQNVQVAVDRLSSEGWQVQADDVSAKAYAPPRGPVIAEHFVATDHPRGLSITVSAGPDPSTKTSVVGGTCQYGPPPVDLSDPDAPCFGGPVMIPVSTRWQAPYSIYTSSRP